LDQTIASVAMFLNISAAAGDVKSMGVSEKPLRHTSAKIALAGAITTVGARLFIHPPSA
jgi:hypothetical protein